MGAQQAQQVCVCVCVALASWWGFAKLVCSLVTEAPKRPAPVEAYAQQSKRYKGNGKGSGKGKGKAHGKGNGTCFTCGKPGHLARDCSDKATV